MESGCNRQDSILLAVQSALVGKIPQHLREIHVDWDDNNIVLSFFFDRRILDEDVCTIDKTLFTLFRFFPDNYITVKYYRLDFPRDIPTNGRMRAFSRKEDGAYRKKLLENNYDNAFFLELYVTRWQGYTERADFGEEIGIYIDQKNTGKVSYYDGDYSV